MLEKIICFNNPEWWSAIGTVGATALALFSILYFELFRKLFERVRVEVFTGDSIDFVISKDLKIYKMQLYCNFVNKSHKFAVIHKVVAKLNDKNTKEGKNLKWRLFFKDIEGGGGVIPESNKPYPISVKEKDNNFKNIEFISDEPIDLKEGKYFFEIIGWVNSPDINSKPKIKKRLTLNITKENIDLKNKLISLLEKQQEDKRIPQLFTIDILEWNLKK